jgi:hypothetical protein
VLLLNTKKVLLANEWFLIKGRKPEYSPLAGSTIPSTSLVILCKFLMGLTIFSLVFNNIASPQQSTIPNTSLYIIRALSLHPATMPLILIASPSIIFFPIHHLKIELIPTTSP